MKVRSRGAAALFAVLLVLEGCGGGMAADAPPRAAPYQAHARQESVQAESKVASADSDGAPDNVGAYPQSPTAAFSQPAEAAPAQPGGPSGGGGQKPKPSPTATDAPHDAAMLIYTARLTMAVYQVESALSAVEQIGRDVGGYLASRSDTVIVLRVPRGRFEDAIKKIEGTGDVVHRAVDAQDVTDEFLDTEIRLKNARAMRDRLQQLLDRAGVKEALEIERELGRITQEIERMEGRLKVLRDKIAYSTITVTFDARAASLKTMPIRLPFGWLQELGLPHLLRLNEDK